MNNTHLLRTALVTGSTSGIGLELTRKLLTDQWQVIGLNRSAFPEHPDIQAALASGQLYAVQADLTNYSSLHAALEHIRFKTKAIDVLFNNAGGSTPRLLYSAQGHELHFELQTVVPYIIYRELYPLLREGRLKTVVNTSTTAFRMLKSFNLQTLEQPASFKKLFGPYAASKLALSLWTQEAAAAAKADGIHLLSVDPGGNNTLRANKLSGIPFYIKPVMKMFFPPPTRGASLLYAAGLGNTTYESGSYLVNNKPARLRFTEQSAAVLHRVEHIYKHKFQSPS